MIRTVDNQDATVQVGKNVPIITGFIPVGTTGSLAPIVRQDGAGIILDVLPRITPDGMIVMKTSIEKSLYETGGVVLVTDPVSGRTITSPVKDVTRAVTTVSLASGETVVMGGLITSSDDTIERKVPWVGDVPILGQLFRYDTKTTERNELLIFLTPRVIRSDADDETLKQIETDRLHFMLDEAESIHGPILSQPSADGLMQQCPPLTMPQSQLPSTVPPAPGVAPSIVPPASMRPSQQPGLPPELPPVLPPAAPGISPAPGRQALPIRPGVAPPIPRETYFDDPSVPTTQMPSDTLHDVKPLRTCAAGGALVRPAGSSGRSVGNRRGFRFNRRTPIRASHRGRMGRSRSKSARRPQSSRDSEKVHKHDVIENRIIAGTSKLPAILAAILMLSGPGCASLQLLNFKTEKVPTADAQHPAIEILAVWQAAEGPGLGGFPTRGFAGQIFFFTQDRAPTRGR